MSILARACVCFMLSASCTVLFAEGQKRLPMPVQKELAEMMKMCKESGGKPVQSPGLLTIVDVTGDGLPEFVIDQGLFNCDGAASLFGGSAGSRVSVYVGTPDGQAVPGFGDSAFGVKVERDSTPAKLLLSVSGPLCGQKITPRLAHSDYKSCWRPLAWNAGSRKLNYAPLSQIRPIE